MTLKISIVKVQIINAKDNPKHAISKNRLCEVASLIT